MEKKVFGYPKYDDNGEMILTTYENEYRDMLMDIRVYKLEKNQTKIFISDDEEIAVLLLNGKIEINVDGIEKIVSRKSVFLEGPYAGMFHIVKLSLQRH